MKKKADDFKISFCVPVYNNDENIRYLADAILSANYNYVQLVFSDDCSQNDIFNLLADYNDNRLKIVRNSTRIGAKQNWINALKEGDGSYLYLIMGRDGIDVKCINSLVEYIDIAIEKKIDLLVDRKCESNYSVYTGIDAYIRFLGQEHPTGLIISKNALNQIENVRDYFETSMAYPEVYMKNEILNSNPKGMVINAGVYKSLNNNINKASIVSKFEPESHPYFFPDRRIEQYEAELDMFYEVAQEYSLSDRLKFVRAKTIDLYEEVTFGYKKDVENYGFATHYEVKKHYVSAEELMTNFIEAKNSSKNQWKRWFDDTEDYLGEYYRIIDIYVQRLNGYDEKTRFQYKYKSMLSMLYEYISLKNKRISYAEYLKKNNVKKVVLYGFSEIGKIIYAELKKSDISVLYAFDKDYLSIYSELDVVPFKLEMYEMPDLVIICMVDDFAIEEIRKQVCELYGNIKIISAETFFNIVDF